MKTMLIVETGKGRDEMLRTAEESLAEGEAIVRITDVVRNGEMYLTVPLDPHAEIVAREPPKLMPGGETHLISYVRIPTRPFEAVRIEVRDGEEDTRSNVTLTPERVGRRGRPRADAAA